MRRLIKRIGTEESLYDTAVFECKTCGDTRTFLGLSADRVHLTRPNCDGIPMDKVAHAENKPSNRVPVDYKKKLANGTRLWCMIHRERGDPTKHDRRGRSPELAERGYAYLESFNNLGIEDFIEDPHY